MTPLTALIIILLILLILLAISARRKGPSDYDNSTDVGYNSRGRDRK